MQIIDVVTKMCDESKEVELSQLLTHLFQTQGTAISSAICFQVLERTKNPILLLLQPGLDGSFPLANYIDYDANFLAKNTDFSPKSAFWSSHKRLGKGFVVTHAVDTFKYDPKSCKIQSLNLQTFDPSGTLHNIQAGIFSSFIPMNGDVWKNKLQALEREGIMNHWVGFIEEVNLCKPGSLLLWVTIEVPFVGGKKTFGYPYRVSSDRKITELSI